MLIVCNSAQDVLAKYKIELGPLLSRDIVVTSDTFRVVIEALRAIDFSLIKVKVCYPLVSDEFFTFNPNRRKQMDIENIVQEFEAKHHKPEKVADAPTLYVAPNVAELPDDGVLKYVTVESVYDLKSTPDRTVVLLREDQFDIVKCVREFPKLFNVNLIVMTGLPGANYSIGFDEATWAYDKIAYAPFISELRVAGEIESQLAAQNSTEYDKEKSQYTRKTGEVKAHTDFVVATSGDDDVEEDAMSI